MNSPQETQVSEGINYEFWLNKRSDTTPLNLRFKTKGEDRPVENANYVCWGTIRSGSGGGRMSRSIPLILDLLPRDYRNQTGDQFVLQGHVVVKATIGFDHHRISKD